jgi:hypothetical protein
MKYPSIVPRDTSIEAFRVQLELYRQMPPEARLQQALEWSEAMREIARSGVRARHPEYSDREVQLATIRLCLGDSLFREAYPGIEVRP